MGKLARATRLVTLNSVLSSLELLIKYLAALLWQLSFGKGFSSFSASRKHTPTLFVGGVYIIQLCPKRGGVHYCSLMPASSS